MHHVNVAFPAVGAGLAGKKYDFLFLPLLVPRRGGQGHALVTGRFCLCLVPGAELLQYEEASIELLLFDVLLWRQEETDKIGILWPDAVAS